MPPLAQHHGARLPRLMPKFLADVFRHLLAKPCDASPGVRRRVNVEPQVSEPVEPQLSLRPFPAALIITKCRDPHAVQIDFSHDLCASEKEHELKLGSPTRERKAAGGLKRCITATHGAAASRPQWTHHRQ